MRILLRSHRTNERKESPTGSAALPEPTELDELMDEISASELGAKRLSDGEKKKAEDERQYEQQLTQIAMKTFGEKKVKHKGEEDEDPDAGE